MLLKRIAAVDFSVLNPDTIRKMSALEVKSADTYDKDGYPMEAGLMDPHLGVINPGLRCKTCGQKMKTCPGHFGVIELVRPVLHSQFSKKVEELLHATCKECGRVMLPDEKIKELQEHVKRTGADLTKYVIAKTRAAKKCQHCNAQKLQMLWDSPTNFFYNKLRIYPTQIREWIEKIPEEELALFGYSLERIRPEWFVLTVLPVPPITIRPSITLETGIKSEDDLTHKLVDIIRINQRLKDNIDAGAPQLIIEDLWDLLQYHVTTYFDNNTAGVPPAKHRSGRALRTLVQRLKGKRGRFRYNLTGKRVNFAARSIITPDPYISINELGVPESIASELTVPEFVTKWNIEEIKKLVKETDKAVYLVRPNESRKRITPENKAEVVKEIEPGFRIERQIIDGDIVLFNMQPSLHRLSMLAHRARVLPYRTFRINPIVCVGGDTKVMLESGTQITIKELEGQWDKEIVKNCDVQNGSIKKTPLTKFWAVSPKELGKKCFAVTTESGIEIEVTCDHPLYSERGIVPAEELKAGEKLIVKPTNTPVLDGERKQIYNSDQLWESAPEKTYRGSMEQKIKKLGLENLYTDDFRARIFARLLGHLFGDGTFILDGHVARAIFRGEKEDLEEIQQDIERLGFKPEKIREHRCDSQITKSDGTQVNVKGIGYSFEVRSKPLCVILNLLGSPKGDKVKMKTAVPAWIMQSNKAIKREFLASYFGSELSTPTQRKRAKSSFQTPIFKLAKIEKVYAKQFIDGIGQILREFDIKIASIYQERGNKRKDGSESIIFSVKLSAEHKSLENLYGKICFVYSKTKENLANLAFQYLKLKEKAILKRKEKYAIVHSMRSQGVKFKEISKAVGISVPMLERWMYNAKTSSLPQDFISFNEWKAEATKGLGETGMVWETISDVRQIELPVVYDITTEAEEHNFFANGILSGNCKPYNADFDGDEMNMHVPQTEEGKTEAKQLMYVQNQTISPRYGAPVIILDEDGVSGTFVLTLKSTKFPRDEAMRILYDSGIDEIPSPDLGKEYSGKLIFSMLLPKNFSIEFRTKACKALQATKKCEKCTKEKCEYDAYLKIKNGRLLCGVVDAAALGEGKGKLVDALAREYPTDVIAEFYKKLLRIAVTLITMRGMTVGIDEYETSEATEKVKEDSIKKEMEGAEALVEKFRDKTLEHIPGRTLEESFEINMLRLGAKTKDAVEKHIMKERIENIMSEKPKLNTIVMVVSGARGSATNLTNVSGFWGQANVREGRPRRGFKGRLIALNEKNDVGALAGGFISRNFVEGMDAKQYFYHSMGGRQGEVDTGVSTKVSGYLYRRLANALKDLVVNNDLTVRTANKNIIQYAYGEDGVFPMHTIRGMPISIKRAHELGKKE